MSALLPGLHELAHAVTCMQREWMAVTALTYRPALAICPGLALSAPDAKKIERKQPSEPRSQQVTKLENHKLKSQDAENY